MNDNYKQYHPTMRKVAEHYNYQAGAANTSLSPASEVNPTPLPPVLIHVLQLSCSYMYMWARPNSATMHAQPPMNYSMN